MAYQPSGMEFRLSAVATRPHRGSLVMGQRGRALIIDIELSGGARTNLAGTGGEGGAAFTLFQENYKHIHENEM